MKAPHVALKRTNRRRFLRGLGVGLALPMMSSMVPVFGRTRASNPRRMIVISNNLGVLPGPFFPTQSGEAYQPSPYLERFSEFKKDFTVFSGLSHPAVVGGHSTENCFLTAAKDPTRSGFRNSISLDQYAAHALKQETRFSTLNLGVNIDRANRSLAWTRDGALLPAEDSPAALFRRMFVQGSRAEIDSRVAQLRKRRSILDAIGDDMRALTKDLGVTDRQRLDQYFNSIRELEQQLHTAGEWEHKSKPTPDQDAPVDIADSAKFFAKFKLMLSMAQLAFETDSTRIVTLMVDAFATPVFDISPSERSLNGYHNLSHHGQVREKVAQLEQVDHQQLRLVRDLIQNLSEKPSGGERLLDQTMVLFGSNMGDANTHDNTNLPILLAGGGFRHGHHLSFDRDRNTPLCNLFVSMLQRLGIESDVFASSSGPLSGLDFVRA